MAKTITLPVLGPTKATYVYAGGALVVGMVAYAWWTYEPVTDIPAYDEEDVSDAVTDEEGGASGGSANSGGADHDSSTTPDTDAEWTNQAVALLEGSYELREIDAALGRYIGQQTLTKLQAEIVRAAIARVGYPPGGNYPIREDVTPTPSALTEPKSLKVLARTSSSIQLGWSAVSGAAGYRVYRSGASENVAHSVDAKATVGGLQPGKSYTFHVRAMDAAGKTGPPSSKLTAKTSETKLTAPKNVRASDITSSSVQLSWSPVSGAIDGYRVYHDKSQQNVAASRDARARVGGLKSNTVYHFHVRAIAGPTTGPKSSRVRVKTKKR